MKHFSDSALALKLVLPAARKGDPSAAPVFRKVLKLSAKSASDGARELSALALFGEAALAQAQGRARVAQERRAQARQTLEALGGPTQSLVSVDALAEGLMELGENVLALPYCHQAAALTRSDPAAHPHRLWRAGRCQGRLGFPQAARDLLRQAIAGLEGGKNASLRAMALLDLGTALSSADPDEAAPALVEAGEIFLSRGQRGLAATAEVNLGVIFSRAHRLDEALAAYERARALRENDPATTPAQRGNLHNNLASVHRRRGDLVAARAQAGRALEILEPEGGEFYAHALGTQGEICRDVGEWEAALAWFSRARAAFEALRAPNRERLAEKLGNEAGALEALGRAAQAAPLRARIAELQAQTPTPPPEASPAARPTPPTDLSQSMVVSLDGVGLPKSVCRKYALDELEEQIEQRLAETGAGVLDGHEHGPETVELFLNGPDARALFEALEPILTAYPLCRGAGIELRGGGEVERFRLTPPAKVRTKAS